MKKTKEIMDALTDTERKAFSQLFGVARNNRFKDTNKKEHYEPMVKSYIDIIDEAIKNEN
tara:strand:- start:2923 stop:3102 length:180 start_codon:yes stop_codon:yes gene_type:complete